MYYQYYCRSCNRRFEEAGTTRGYPPFDNIPPINVTCPYCGSDYVEEDW